jgi:ribosomal protein S18 acetylase RimI-like enzyme
MNNLRFQDAFILNNPIWHAAITNNQSIAKLYNQVTFFKRDIAWFAAMQNNSKVELLELLSFFETRDNIILFTEDSLDVPKEWKTLLEKPLAQLVFKEIEPFIFDATLIKPLGYEHVGQMLALTALTKPGPFFSKTIEFGDYYGIFENDQLVSMAGSRLSPGQYTEISAVCTHPDYVGKGYAGSLIKNQVNIILSQGKWPFLHAYSDNPALSLYHKLGFELRKELIVYRLEKL